MRIYSIFAHIFLNLGNKYYLFGPKNNILAYILWFRCCFHLKFAGLTAICEKFHFVNFFYFHSNLGNKYGIFGPENNIFAYISWFPCYLLLKSSRINRYKKGMWFGKFFGLCQNYPNLGYKYVIFKLKATFLDIS